MLYRERENLEVKNALHPTPHTLNPEEGTRLGACRDARSPCPSCPREPNPQEYAAPGIVYSVVTTGLGLRVWRVLG